MRESFMNNPDINFLYDPTYNNIPTLQNKYMSSTFFPRNAMWCKYEHIVLKKKFQQQDFFFTSSFPDKIEV